MSEANRKYGLLITDENHIQRVKEDMQNKIDQQKESAEYSEDGMKSVILNKLDNLDIYPDDIDYIFSELDF